MAKNAAMLRQWVPMLQASMDFDLADSSVTDALGAALARSFPGAADAVPADAVPAGAIVAGAIVAGAIVAGAMQADAVQAGAVLYLQGDLGAGKTSCARSLLRALGAAGLVRSPTYTLIETYQLGGLTCLHVDLYRLQSRTEVDELGLRDVVGPGCLLLVEWPERGCGALPPADLNLHLSYAGDARHAHLRALTPLGIKWLDKLGRDNSFGSYVSN